MRLPVTDSGVILPKSWFGIATEVSVRNDHGHITVEPIAEQSSLPNSGDAYAPADPIWNLRKLTSDLAIDDASVNLDQYLYNPTDDTGQRNSP